MDSTKEIQRKYLELQDIEQQLTHLQQQLQLLHQHFTELVQVDRFLEDLKNSDDNSQMYATLAPGIFVKAQLQDTKNVLMNTGANTLVQKTIDEAKESLNHQIMEIQKVLQQTEEQLQTLATEGQHLQQELKTLVEKS